MSGEPRAAISRADGARLSSADIFLQPAEYFVGDATHRIRTLLGSCVSVTLWSPARRVGAMSHFLLASRGRALPAIGAACASELQSLDARYGDEALALMRHELGRLGVDPAQCQAKIFGGGNMFPLQNKTGAQAIGRRNGEAARELLLAHGIRVASESLFGDGYRQIVFDVATGDVWSRQAAPGRDAMPGNKPAQADEGSA